MFVKWFTCTWELIICVRSLNHKPHYVYSYVRETWKFFSWDGAGVPNLWCGDICPCCGVPIVVHSFDQLPVRGGKFLDFIGVCQRFPRSQNMHGTPTMFSQEMDSFYAPVVYWEFPPRYREPLSQVTTRTCQ